MRQLRQRRGLRQCVHWICQPNQVPLVEKLGWSLDKVSFLPFPYFVPLEPTEVADSRQLTFNEMLFMHPTRQLFRALDKNLYLKGNDKLIRAFAAFKAETGLPGRLRMVRKGRDVDAADELVSELGLRSHVDWVNEMSNLDLRRYYSIPNAVICDQFDPSLGYLGAIGREASMYGRPLITAFEDHNRRLFGDDMPPHVFPATTEVGIMQAMIKLAAMEPKEIAELQLKARQWSHRHFSPSCLLPRFKEVFVKAMKANTSQRVAS